jgi:leader peptidase (prepilin peptidase)/N-methyltransferase
MIRVLGTIFAGLLGLAFGSFLNVCLSRWPRGESIVHPRSHCRRCGRTLAWWENVPLVSWLFLRGRCRSCRVWIGWRYPLVELAVGALWATVAWKFVPEIQFLSTTTITSIASGVALMALIWLLVALAALDAEHQWLPDFLTLPGICVGLLVTFLLEARGNSFFRPANLLRILLLRVAGILAAAGLILLIRWIYWLIRRREGIGLGDAKLMAMLAAWLGLPGALLAFGLGVVLGSIAALVLLVLPSTRKSGEGWAHIKLPLGTFLCMGGIIGSLWGERMIAAYLRWAGF